MAYLPSADAPVHTLSSQRAALSATLAALLLLLLASPSLGEARPPASMEAVPAGGEMMVRATLRADWRSAEQAKLGVHFELAPGWHLYWRNPGDTGLAPRFEWQVGEAEVGPMAWPLPQRFVDTEIELVSYGYEEQVLLAVPLRAGAGKRLPERVGVDVHFLVCADQCIPGQLSLSTPLPQEPVAATRALFSAWEARLPQAPEDAGIAISALEATLGADASLALALDIDLCAAETGACAAAPADGAGIFYPHQNAALEGVASSVSDAAQPGHFRLALAAEVVDDSVSDGILRGVLLVKDGDERRGIELAIPWQARPAAAIVATRGTGNAVARVAEVAPAAAAVPVSGISGMGLLRAAFLGFLGGLILNLMPCVLPVLALKVFALTDLASRSRREVAWHVGGYTGGILLAMGVLAGLVIGLRAAGSAVGWGFHLQEPTFVVAVCALLVAFALNLFGVFEIHVDTSRLAGVGVNSGGTVRSFFDGLLAVVLATPCSAPFLGTAVGFAFASSGFVITTIFASIGLGLAAPFALVAAVPSLSRLMPRSGPWMLHLRAGLGFALLGSAVWLLWVLGRASGADAMAGTLVLLVIVALAVWTFGLLQRLGRPLPLPALLLVLVATLVGGIHRVDFSPPSPETAAAQSETGVEAWDHERVQEVLANGQPAFVYFTADWCITCKVNEARVLKDPTVTQTFRALGIPIFRGDWTRRDETIRLQLAKLGKAGVPAYALYQPHNPEQPRVLPELLNVAELVAALEQASAAASAGIRRADIAPELARSDKRS